MQQIKPFPRKSFTAGAQYDTELQAVQVGGVVLLAGFDATDGTGGSTARDDASMRLLGTPEIVQNEDPLVRLTGPDWLHLAAIANGGYPGVIDDDVASGATEPKVAIARLPFSKIIPGMAINAVTTKVFVRGTFGALSDFSVSGGNLSGITGELLPYVETIEGDMSRGHIRPRFDQLTVDVSSSSADIQVPIRFEEDTYMPGLLLRAYDASAAAHNVDGLVKRLAVEVSDANGTREIIRASWGQLRQWTVQRFGLNTADSLRSAGVVWLPMQERGLPGNAKFFRAGDSIAIRCDTAATVDAHLTSLTPASGDLLYISKIAGVAVEGGRATAGNMQRIRQARRRNRAVRQRGRGL